MAKSRVVGLDLGSTCVRAAEVELPSGGREPRLLRFGEQPVDHAAMRDGEVARPEVVVDALRALWKRERFTCKDVVLGIGNQRVFVRDLTLPAAPLDQLRASLRFGPVQDLLPVRVEDCLLDFYPVATDGVDQVHGMLVAVPEETVEANTSAAAEAGLRPVRVDLNAFGLLRALVHGDSTDRVVGIVDVGAAITDILVVDHGVLRLYRTLPTGSQDVAASLKQALAVSDQVADEVKRTYGIVAAASAAAEVAQAVEVMTRRVRMLSDAVHASFSYYSGATGRAVERLLLAGRGARMPGLGQYLSTALGVPAAFATADAHLALGRDLSAPDVLERVRPVLPVAVGLARGAAA